MPGVYGTFWYLDRLITKGLNMNDLIVCDPVKREHEVLSKRFAEYIINILRGHVTSNNVKVQTYAVDNSYKYNMRETLKLKIDDKTTLTLELGVSE